MEESNDGSLELGSTAGVDGCGGEGLPHDGLADVGGDEQGDARAQSVSFLKKFVQKQNDQSGDEKLDRKFLTFLLLQ